MSVRGCEKFKIVVLGFFIRGGAAQGSGLRGGYRILTRGCNKEGQSLILSNSVLIIGAKQMVAYASNFKKRAIEKLDLLSPDRLKVVLDFIEYIEQKEDTDATLEILADKNSMYNIKEADDAWESGRMNEFVPWNKVKRHV